jgi:hypothetical protein
VNVRVCAVGARGRGKEGVNIQPRSPWAQRMIQFELSLVYFATFCSKVKGALAARNRDVLYLAGQMGTIRLCQGEIYPTFPARI